MSNLYVNLYEIKTNKLVAFYCLKDKHISRELAIQECWYRAVDENKVCIDAHIDEYRFELVYK